MNYNAGDKVTINGAAGFKYLERAALEGYVIAEYSNGTILTIHESALEPDLPDMSDRPIQRTLQAGMSVAYLHQQNHRKLQ